MPKPTEPMLRVCIVLIALLPLRISAQFQDLDFEQWEEDIPIHWSPNQYATLSKDSIQQVNGSFSLKLVGSGGSVFFSQGITLKDDSLRRYEVKGQVNTKGLEGGAGLFVAVQGPDGNTFYNQQLQPKADGWQEVSLDILVHAEAIRVFVGGLINGRGEALFDAFEIVERAPLSEEIQTEATSLIEEVGNIIEVNSLQKGKIALDSLFQNARTFGSFYSSTNSTHVVIWDWIKKLGDGHSRFLEPIIYKGWKGGDLSAQEEIVTRVIEGIAYLKIPVFRSGNPKMVDDYVEKLKDLVHEMNTLRPSGWIIDLRDNQGGHAYAMLAGLSHFFQDGDLSKMTYRDGSKKAVKFRKGDILFDEEVQVYSSTETQKIEIDKLAVLVSGGTASAGELVAISLKSVEEAKLFGQTTAGFTTNTEEFPLSDGSAIFLATSIYTDLEDNVYSDAVVPDYPVYENDDEDRTMKAAILWLLE